MIRNSSISARFLSDAGGSVSALMGMSLVLVTILGGMAIDMGRWTHSQKTTQDALDAAVLAGARWLAVNPGDDTGAVEVARKYYEENVRARVDLIVDTVDFAVEDGGAAVSAVGEAALATTLMKIAGIDGMPLFNSANAGLSKASITAGGSNIEVSLMLDVTGSMCDDGAGPCTTGVKLDSVKLAAKKLVDIVVSADQSEVSSKVALVPFSTRVRVAPASGGDTMMKALTNLDGTWSGWRSDCIASTGEGGSEDGGNWVCTDSENNYKTNWPIMPCVTDRFYESSGVFDFTDDVPGPGKWLNAHDGTRSPYFEDSSDMYPHANPTGTAAEEASQWNYTDGVGYCSDVAAVNEIMPLTSNSAGLHARIDGLRAKGATAGPLGTAWSWYMLSPKWAGSVWQGEAAPGSYSDLTTPGPNGGPSLRKVAILMTDGVYNTSSGSKDQDMNWMSDTAKEYCANMKAAGIEIYTVGVALDELSATERAIAEDTLLSCGTDVEHFYNTLSADELFQAFESIGLGISGGSRVTLTR